MQETRRIQLGTKVYEDGVSSTTPTPNKGSAPSSNGSPGTPASVSGGGATTTQQSISKHMPAIMIHNNKPVLVNLSSGSSFGNGKCVTVSPSQMVPLEKSSRISMIAGAVRVGPVNGTVTKRIGLTSVGQANGSISAGGVINIGAGNNRTLTTGNGSLAFPLKVIKSSTETNKSSPIDLLSTPITDFSSIRSNTRPLLFQVVKQGSVTSGTVSSSTLTPTSSPTGTRPSVRPSPNIKPTTTVSESGNSSNSNFVSTSSSPSQNVTVASPVFVSTSSSDEPNKKPVTSPNSSNSSTPAKNNGRGSKKHPENHVKRPMNRFMVWSQIQRKKMFQNKPEVHNAQISKLLGEMWRGLTDEEREPFVEMAKNLEKEHAKKYPDYKYRPRKKQSTGQKKDGNVSGSSTTPTKPGVAKTPAKNAVSQGANQVKGTPRFNIGNSPFSNITVVNNGSSLNGCADPLLIHSPPSCSDGSILSSSDAEIQDLLESVGQKDVSINVTPYLMDCSNGGTMKMSSCDTQCGPNERSSGLLTPVSSMSDNANQDSNMDIELSMMDLISGDFDPFDFSSCQKDAIKFTDIPCSGQGAGNVTSSSSLASTLHNPMILLSDLAEGVVNYGDDDPGYFSPLFESPTPSTGSQLDNDDSLSAWFDDSPAEDWLQGDTLNSWMDTLASTSGPLNGQDYTYASFDFP